MSTSPEIARTAVRLAATGITEIHADKGYAIPARFDIAVSTDSPTDMYRSVLADGTVEVWMADMVVLRYNKEAGTSWRLGEDQE